METGNWKLENGIWKLETRNSKLGSGAGTALRRTRHRHRGSFHFRISSFQFLKVDREARGFTLLELMMVMTLILILASFAVQSYTVAVQRAREAVLRDDLY